VRLRIAEVSEHAIAHVFRDEPAALGDLLGAASVIGADDLPHVLGVEPGRKRSRAHQIDEHYRDLAAFGRRVALIR
jgi:hypothetical protein